MPRYWIIRYSRPAWWRFWPEDLYLNKNLMETMKNRGMASVFDDVVEADRAAEEWREQLFKHPDKWEIQIIPLN